MAEYINRAMVLAEYDRLHNGPPGAARRMIETFPAADVRPGVHGEWMVGDYEEGTWECSNCGLLWMLNDGTPEENNMNFCTYCGADMREETC